MVESQDDQENEQSIALAHLTIIWNYNLFWNCSLTWLFDKVTNFLIPFIIMHTTWCILTLKQSKNVSHLCSWHLNNLRLKKWMNFQKQMNNWKIFWPSSLLVLYLYSSKIATLFQIQQSTTPNSQITSNVRKN